MSWFIKDENFNNEPFAYIPNFFDDADLKLINEIVASIDTEKATIESSSPDEEIQNADVRVSDLCWIKPSEQSRPIFQKLVDGIEDLNERFYRFNIVELEDLQYTEYSETDHGKYDSHSDDGYFNMFRKLSFSVQLSDENEYEGGDFNFYRHSITEKVTAPKTKGTFILFPSYVIHEVTPVTKGLRKSLVSWVQGPRFK